MDAKTLADYVIRAKAEERGMNEIIHQWLQGCQQIVEGIKLSETPVIDYLVSKSREFLPFTILQRSSFLKYLDKMHGLNSIGMFQIPVSNHYHLQFPLLESWAPGQKVYEFISDPCKLGSICGVRQPHNLPFIYIRKSIMMDEVMRKAGGSVMYNNRVGISDLDSEAIHETCNTLENFITSCRVEH